MTTNATTPALTEEEKYKKSDWTMGDTAKMGAVPTYLGLKTLGGGSATQGLATTAKVAGIGAKSAGKGVAGFVGNSVKSAGGVKGLVGKGYVPAGVALSSIHSYNTPTDNYYERHSWLPKPDSDDSLGTELGKDLLARTVGVAGDTVSNVFTWGGLGDKFFKDRIRENNEALAQQAQQQTSSTQADKLEALSEQMQPEAPQGQPIQIGGIGNNAISQSLANTPQATPYQGGLTAENPNYQSLMRQVEQSGTLADNQKPFLGIKTRAPQRDWENEAQRKDLLQQATTVIKGAHGLTANQMRLAHELSNDDIKMAQERHLQQNQLNHQLQQEQMQQQAQNQRALLGETGQTARAIMNEQGQNARFNTNFGLDVAKFNQDAQNNQYELGLKGADLRSRLQSQAIDDSVKQGHLDLYNQFINAKDDEQRDKILTQMAVLSGKGGGDKGDSYATMNLGEQYDPETQMTINRGQALYNTRTGQVVGGQSGQNNNANWNDPKNLQAFEKELTSKKVTGEQAQAIAQKYGIPPEFIAQYFGEQQ